MYSSPQGETYVGLMDNHWFHFVALHYLVGRSVFMQLLKAISSRKLVLEKRTQLKAEIGQVVSTAVSKAEIEQERRIAGEPLTYQ